MDGRKSMGLSQNSPFWGWMAENPSLSSKTAQISEDGLPKNRSVPQKHLLRMDKKIQRSVLKNSLIWGWMAENPKSVLKNSLFEDGWPKIQSLSSKPQKFQMQYKSNLKDGWPKIKVPQNPGWHMDMWKNPVLKNRRMDCPQNSTFWGWITVWVKLTEFQKLCALEIQLAQRIGGCKKSKHSILLLLKRRHFYLDALYPEPGRTAHSLAATGVWDQRWTDSAIGQFLVNRGNKCSYFFSNETEVFLTSGWASWKQD